MVLIRMLIGGILLFACSCTDSTRFSGGQIVLEPRAVRRGPAPLGSDLGSVDPIYKDKEAEPRLTANSRQTGAEEKIRKLLFASEKAWNEKNTDLFLSFFSADAQIMVGREQKIVSKPAYAKMFPDAFDKAGKVKYDSLSINILDPVTAEAEGVASISADGGIIWLTKKLRLVKKDDQWLIEESLFEIYFKGDGDPRDRFRPRSGGESPQ